MQKKFITNLVLILGLNILVKPLYIFGIDLGVQNSVGAESYGLYFAIFNFSMIFNIFLDVGITNFNNRNISQNRQLLNKHFSGIVALRLLLAVVFAIITFSVALIVGYRGYMLYLLGFLAFNQFLLSFILYLRSNISGLLLFKTDSILSVLDRIVLIIVCGYLLYFRVSDTPFKIEWFVYSQTLAYLITVLIALIIVIRKSAFNKLNWNFLFFLVIIKKSWPFALLFLLMMLYGRVDSVFIERLLPENQGALEAGIYASAYRLLDAVNNIGYLFSVLLLPIFSRMIKIKENINDLVKLSFSLIAVFSVTIAVLCFFFNAEIIELLYEEHIDASAKVFRIVILTFFPLSTSYIFGTLLTANGSLKQLNLVAAFAVIFHISLNLILIPKFQAFGSAIAGLITQSLTAIAQLIIAVVIFKMRFNLRFVIRFVVFVGGFVLATSLIYSNIDNWALGFGLSLLSALVIAFSIRLISLRNIFVLIKEPS